MPLPKFLSNIFGGGASELLQTADKLIDNLTLSKEEKEQFKVDFLKASNEHIEKMAGMAENEMEAYLKDVQDARGSNVKVQESDKASWLSKNIAYCIDIAVTLVWCTFTLYIMAKAIKLIDDKADMTAVLSIYATVTAVFFTSLNFHRGSSVGSKANGDTMRKLLEDK